MITSTRNRATAGKKLAIALLVAALAASLMLAAKSAHASTTFTVNSTADYGDQTPGDGKCYTGNIIVIGEQCTLRAAIQEANATTGADNINFAIPGTGGATITPATELPKITGPVSINGYSQPGAQPNTKAVGSDAVLKIRLTGDNEPDASGLVIGASGSTVKGLLVNNWNQGIRIEGSGATGNRITGNYIGTDPDGTAAYPGNHRGVYVPEGSNNTIGGATPAARNVISNNREIGINIDSEATGTRVLGNYIGTDASGTQDFGNAFSGVNVEGALDTTIGGTTAGERNVISGNDGDGVSIDSRGAKVTGNYIGTDASGTKDLGNSDDGVSISGANNTVGGTTAGERNTISGNDDNGVAIDGGDATGNKVTGNYIGTDASGTRDLGNGTPLGLGGSGVLIADSPNNTVGGTEAGARNVISANDVFGVRIQGGDATGNKVMGNYVGTDKNGTADLGNVTGIYISDAPNNTVGGAMAGTRNTISGNLTGVSIYGSGATGNRVLSNSIFANAGLGIDLGDDGPTANDPGDTDTGANDLQNKPVLSSAKKSATGTTTVRGTLNSTPGKTFTVQFFSNPSGTDEGKTFLFSKSVSTNATGNVSLAFSTTKQVTLGQNITATATSPGGNTSEFSAPTQVVAQ